MSESEDRLSKADHGARAAILEGIENATANIKQVAGVSNSMATAEPLLRLAQAYAIVSVRNGPCESAHAHD